jgi:hypothetical protein
VFAWEGITISTHNNKMNKTKVVDFI